VRFQPSTGLKLAETTFSGNCTVTLVVSALSRSFGTLTANRAKPPASHSRGLSVT
jgi:hypothetical protein